jgi:uncharacterized phage infection (PIP) family protein YhgE
MKKVIVPLRRSVMRRVVFTILGLLELGIGVVLLGLGAQLPDGAEVQRGFQGAERVTSNAGTQTRLLRRQVQDLRRPELQLVAQRLQTQTRSVTTMLKQQQIDFESLQTMRDALGEVAGGLDSLADSFDAGNVRKLGDALGETAVFLEERVVPGASKAADQIETSTKALRADAQHLADLLKAAPPDLKAAREVHDSLARFGEGLDKMHAMLKTERLTTMRDGFTGLETALSTGAEQVERLAGYTYPVVQFNGLKVEVEQKKFWPEGDKIAEGMRKARDGVVAAGKEIDGLGKDLPKLQASLDESRKVVHKTREALAAALAQQNKVEPLLKEMPSHAAKLSEELPKIGDDLAKMLRDTDRLKEVAGSLRQGQKAIHTAVGHWPEMQTALHRSAKLLRATRGQLDHAVEHKHDYEAAVQQSVVLADSFATLLPLLTDQLDTRLDEEENALRDLEQSLGEVQGALPAYSRTAQDVVLAGRWLAWLVAAIAALHGVYLILSARLGRRFSF